MEKNKITAFVSKNKELLNGIELPAELAGKEVVATYLGAGMYLCTCDGDSDSWSIPEELLKFKTIIYNEDSLLGEFSDLLAYSLFIGIMLGVSVSYLFYRML